MAATIADSIAARPIMCDLVSAQSAVLEHNISPEVALRHKHAIGREVETIVAAIVRAIPDLTAAQAYQVIAYTLLLTAGAWPQTRPPAALQAAYESDPAVAATQMDFTETIRDLITVAIAGQLAIS
ncbi:hypothetical protein [Gordonia crocea]|uniref:Tetracyclin repressor-like C-terminal domain-containing protein n=1 Tax=Gordonia crocea TaxID=589162 RepID=A0A7I9UXN3_9ACTN|nr:hypothetical protein [Gordonia crocea]GED97954.1 hypothetical protein nbrc107697_19930 [Gordonia crocea]